MTLVEFIRGELGKPFVWGETNCVALAFRALDAMTNGSTIDKYRKHMSSQKKALAWTIKNGMDGLVSTLKSEGCIEVPVTHVQDGDIILGLTEDKQLAAHVVFDKYVMSSSQTNGVALGSLVEAKAKAHLALRLQCQPQ